MRRIDRKAQSTELARVDRDLETVHLRIAMVGLSTKLARAERKASAYRTLFEIEQQEHDETKIALDEIMAEFEDEFEDEE